MAAGGLWPAQLSVVIMMLERHQEARFKVCCGAGQAGMPREALG